MSNLKRLKTLLLINSKVKKSGANGYKAVCFTKIGSEYMNTMFKDKSNLTIEEHFTSPFFNNKEDKLKYLCEKNKSLELMVKLLELE
jgi:hypothetical protein